jgi:hypothetical protein
MPARPSDNELQAMTTGERLSMIGLYAEYEQAIAVQDRDKMIAILQQAAFDRESAERTVETQLTRSPPRPMPRPED